jgi:hypothetical protein
VRERAQSFPSGKCQPAASPGSRNRPLISPTLVGRQDPACGRKPWSCGGESPRYCSPMTRAQASFSVPHS